MWGGRGSKARDSFKITSVTISRHRGKEEFLVLKMESSKSSQNVPYLPFPRPTNIFWKGSDSKYFRLVAHLVSVTTTQLCGCNIKAALDTTEVNGRG